RGKAVRDAFAVADLFVLPSVSEPFGLTALEAAYYSTPSLVSRQAGVNEVLRNVLRIDYWDINEMANQITSVVQNEALHDVLVANVEPEVKGLSWHSSSQKIMDLYRAHAI